LTFGVDNRADRDWGDLPASYITRASDSVLGGPSHAITPGFQLGVKNDGEVNGIPTPGANGDDLIGQDDDGIRIISNSGSLRVGANLLQVTVQGVGGLLNGWFDLNGNGTFDDGEQLLTDIDLNPGIHTVIVDLPATTVSGPLAARFRWGEEGLSFEGPAGAGEVEDYFLPNSIVSAVVLPGDYDLSGTVDDADYDLWRATFGTSDLRADGNGDGAVDAADYSVWRNNMGATSGTGTAVGAVGASDSFVGPMPPRLAPVGVAQHFSDAPALQEWLQRNQLSERLRARGVGNSNLLVASAPSVLGNGAMIGHTARKGSGNAGSNADTSANDTAVSQAVSPFVEESLLSGLQFSSVVNSSGSTSTELIGGAAVVESVADSSLLLLDQALADLDGDDHLGAGNAVWCNRDGEDDSVNDLALAAVLDDQTAWWQPL
jgi:hypothetical protein